MSISYDIVLHKRPVERIYRLRSSWPSSSPRQPPSLCLAPPNVPLNSILLSSSIGFVFGLLLFDPQRSAQSGRAQQSDLRYRGLCLLLRHSLHPWGHELFDNRLALAGRPGRPVGFWPAIPLTELLWTFAMGFYFGIIYKFAAGSGYQ